MTKQFTCYILLIFGIFLTRNASAQLYDESYAVQSIAMSNQSVALSNSFSAIGNPSLMSENKNTMVGITVSNKFFLRTLKLGGIGITHKFTRTDAFGFAIQFDGTSNLKQNNIALAYSKKINEKFNAGLSVIYLNTFEQTIGTKNNIIGKAGITYQPSHLFLIGATVYNPFAAKLTSFTKERIPTLFSAGICYKVSKQVKVYAEYKLDLKEVRNFKAGISYEPRSNIIVYAGFQNSNSPLSFGFTFKTKNININIATQYHQLLGFSPAVGFDWEKE